MIIRDDILVLPESAHLDQHDGFGSPSLRARAIAGCYCLPRETPGSQTRHHKDTECTYFESYRPLSPISSQSQFLLMITPAPVDRPLAHGMIPHVLPIYRHTG